jgi:hypothetical protein
MSSSSSSSTQRSSSVSAASDFAEFHVLPAWFETLQNTVFLSALILAEMFVNGLMMTFGIVPDIQNPATWGIFGTLGVIVMFAAGMLMGGMSVRCSSAFFVAAKEHDWGFALANLIGLVLFGVPEVWASLVERSTHLQVNAPDRLAMSLTGNTNWGVTPTAILISIGLPLAAAYWGISSHKRPSKTPEQIAQEQRVKLAQLAYEEAVEIRTKEKVARIREAQLRGAASTAATAKESWQRVRSGAAAHSDASGASGSDAGSDAGSDPDTDPDDDPSGGTRVLRGTQGSALPNAAALRSLPHLVPSSNRTPLNGLTAVQRVRKSQQVRTSDLADILGVSESRALTLLRDVPEVSQDGAHTRAAYIAPLSSVKAHLRTYHPAHYVALQAAIRPGGRATRASHSSSDARRSATPMALRPLALVGTHPSTHPGSHSASLRGAPSDDGYAEA